jgi:hypothetical protein
MDKGIEDFNAESAREILSKLQYQELHSILLDIKYKAEQGESKLHVYNLLKPNTIESLKDKGFEIHSNILNSRDELYYTIRW